MTARPCLDCGTPTPGTRCPACAPAENQRRQRTKPTATTRTSRERRRRAHAVQAWRRLHGDWCPGYDVPPHADADLCADHIIAVAVVGSGDGPLQVLCRRCNAAKGARTT